MQKGFDLNIYGKKIELKSPAIFTRPIQIPTYLDLRPQARNLSQNLSFYVRGCIKT